MIRSCRLSLAVALAACATGAALARAADPPLPPPTAPAETTVSFPSPHVRRWQIGVRADRLQHASLSMALGLSAGLTTREPAAAASSLAFGLAKELWDVRRGKGFDVWDLVADALGAAAGAGATAALQDQP